jgi:hypothetical protein
MKPRFVALIVVAAGFGLLRTDLDACGDKSLSPGGIFWARAQAARYPAAILIYAKPNSPVAAAARELKLQQTLQQVGHTFREVTSWTDAEAALASGRFNIVMADAVESASLQQRLKTSNSKAVVIPVAFKPTKAEEKAAKQLKFLVKAPSRAAEYLNTITDAVRAGSNTPH